MWYKWIHTLPTDIQIIIKHCPQIFITQLNMIENLVPPNTKIESIYVPYYCQKCDEIQFDLFNLENEVKNIPKKLACNICQAETELDIITKKYFKFILS